jgi:hypothetical protein
VTCVMRLYGTAVHMVNILSGSTDRCVLEEKVAQATTSALKKTPARRSGPGGAPTHSSGSRRTSLRRRQCDAGERTHLSPTGLTFAAAVPSPGYGDGNSLQPVREGCKDAFVAEHVPDQHDGQELRDLGPVEH